METISNSVHLDSQKAFLLGRNEGMNFFFFFFSFHFTLLQNMFKYLIKVLRDAGLASGRVILILLGEGSSSASSITLEILYKKILLHQPTLHPIVFLGVVKTEVSCQISWHRLDQVNSDGGCELCCLQALIWHLEDAAKSTFWLLCIL